MPAKDLIASLTPEMIAKTPPEELILSLISVLEDTLTELENLREANRTLKDEINRLKGEQGRPEIAKKKKGDSGGNYSTEKERSKGKSTQKGRGKRNHKVSIHKTTTCHVDKKNLPPDAIFKGYSEVIVQDIVVIPVNTKFRCERYYSPKESQTYVAKRPVGYEGEFGPGIKSMIVGLKSICNQSEGDISKYLNYHGVYISQSTISRKLIYNNDIFHTEAEEILKAGVESTRFLQTDTTGANVNGKQHHTHIICNPLYTAFRTVPRKDRLTNINLLMGGKERKYLFNDISFQRLSECTIAKKWVDQIYDTLYGQCLNESELTEKLSDIFGADGFKTNKKRVMEAGFIAYYQSQTEYSVPEVLLTDDAPQYDKITKEHQLCWVHEARHYKKLNPIISLMRETYEAFMVKFWKLYREMIKYKENPTPKFAQKIRQKFEILFQTTTIYGELNRRIQKTYRNKEQLLTFLKYPEVPLHNNGAELGARAQVRYRDVSLFTRNDVGTKAVDSYMTIVKTAIKLGVNPFGYIHDLITGEKNHMSLSDIIQWISQKTTVGDQSEKNYPAKANKQWELEVPTGVDKSTLTMSNYCSI